jgi:glyoxylase-like metal-dependent hydrolase (beta-lactamase superfamily II)
LDPGPHWGEVGIHGVPRLREWDAVVTVDAPDEKGDEVERVVLDPAGDPFAEALASAVEPPFRLRAVRRDARRWAVAGRRVRVVHLPGVAGEELTLTVEDGRAALVVDGMPTAGVADAVIDAVRPSHASYLLSARRVEGERWEVDVVPL